MKKLSEYIDILKASGLLFSPYNGAELDIDAVAYNSESVVPGTLFVCKGIGFKEEYLHRAIALGAVAYVSDRVYTSVKIPCVLVNNSHNALSLISQHYFDYPATHLTLIGVTGTKGKSTTCYFIKAILDLMLFRIGKRPAAIISSIETDDGVTRGPSTLTTPESFELQQHLRNAVNSGREYCVCECSSQALKYGRVFGITFDFGLFLNIGEDHISPVEHPDLMDYFNSKLKLMAQSRRFAVNLGANRHSKVNIEKVNLLDGTLTFGMRPWETGDFTGSIPEATARGCTFNIQKNGQWDHVPFTIPMAGLFNVENALAAVCCCNTLGVDFDTCRQALATVNVPGRMEILTSKQGNKVVIVDYAHNQMSLTSLFQAAKEAYPERGVVLVIGSVGDKAQTRRRDIGMIAGIQASCVYFTEDNPGNEDVLDICEEMAGYARLNCASVSIVADRKDAIRRAVLNSPETALILLAGRGREAICKRGDTYFPYPSDIELAHNALGEYDASPRMKYTNLEGVYE